MKQFVIAVFAVCCILMSACSTSSGSGDSSSFSNSYSSSSSSDLSGVGKSMVPSDFSQGVSDEVKLPRP